jgi:hypothetical protein
MFASRVISAFKKRMPRSLTLSRSLMLLWLLPILAITQSCQQPVQEEPGKPVRRKTESVIPQVYAGDIIRVNVKMNSKDLATSGNADVTMINAVKSVLDDAWQDEVSVTAPLTGTAPFLSFEVPTTLEFRPGVWHFTEIKLKDQKTGKTKTLKEGVDFDGYPFAVVNASKLSSHQPDLDITGVETKD